MINPMDFFKVKGMLGEFSANHPKFFPFLQAVSQAGAREGTIVEMAVTTPEGQKLETNLRLTQSDIELIHMIREIAGHGDRKGEEKPAAQKVEDVVTDTDNPSETVK